MKKLIAIFLIFPILVSAATSQVPWRRTVVGSNATVTPIFTLDGVSATVFNATSTTATSTFANGIRFTGGSLSFDLLTGCNGASVLETDANGSLQCGADASGAGGLTNYNAFTNPSATTFATSTTAFSLPASGFIGFAGNTTVDTTNYSLFGSATLTLLNARSGASIGFRINNADVANFTTTGGFGFGSTYYNLDPGQNKMIIESSLGVGTSTPGTLLSIGADGTGINFVDNATSTFSRGIRVGGFSTFTGLSASASSTFASDLNISGNAMIGGTTKINGLTYTWPAAQSGTQCLQNNGSGTLTWAACSAAGITNYDAFTHVVTGTSATSTEMRFTGGLISNASSTFTSQLNVSGLLNASSTILGQSINTYSTTATSTFLGGFTAGNNTAFTVNRGATANSLYVAENGNVGIGTTNPGQKLHIEANQDAATVALIKNTSAGTGASTEWRMDNGTNQFQLFMTGTGYTGLGGSRANTGNIYMGSANPILFWTSGSEKMRIDSTGNVGIGTTSPASLLSVQGNALFSGNLSLANLTATGTLTVSGLTTLGYASTTQIGSTGSAYFATTNGNVGIGETAPGSKLSVSGGGSFGASYDTTAAPTNGLIIEGNVGIGDSNPTLGKLRVSQTGTAATNRGMYISATGAGTTNIAIAADATTATNNYAFYSDYGNAVFGISTGNVGIGTTSPSQLLSAQGNSLTSGTSTSLGGFLTATGTVETNFFRVTGTATSTFTSGGLSVAGGGLLSSAGLTITGGNILSSGLLNITNTATSTFSGGITHGGFSTFTGLSATASSTFGNVLNVGGTLFASAGLTVTGTLSLPAGSVTNAMLANSTISGAALGGTLANLTATDGTLTFSGTYTGATARTIGIASAFAGRSLTITTAILDVDAELYTRSITFNVSSSTMGTTTQVSNFTFPTNSTITEVSCSDNQGQTQIQLDERSSATPNTAGTNILSSALACTTGTASTTSFANTAMNAGGLINLQITGAELVSPRATILRVNVKYTIDY